MTQICLTTPYSKKTGIYTAISSPFTVKTGIYSKLYFCGYLLQENNYSILTEDRFNIIL